MAESNVGSATISKHPISGRRVASLAQMIAFTTKVNPGFNPKIADAYVKVGDRYNIRGDMALCQAIIETNWFRFGGDVQAGQNNFAGLGASGGVKGSSFPTIEEGVTAHIQHLFAYATTSPLPTGEKIVDSRFTYVTRGSAPTWEDLAGKWAVPGYNKSKYSSLEQAMQAGATYGQQIVAIHQQLLQTAVPPIEEPHPANGYPPGTPQWKQEAVEWLYQQGLLTSDEWRGRLEEPLPLWAKAVMLQRLFNSHSGDVS